MMVFLQRNEDFFRQGGVSVSGSLSSLLQTCALNAALGATPGARIDQAGHLGGFLGGAACSYAFGPRLRRARLGYVVDEPLLRPPRPRLPRRLRPARRRARRPPSPVGDHVSARAWEQLGVSWCSEAGPAWPSRSLRVRSEL